MKWNSQNNFPIYGLFVYVAGGYIYEAKDVYHLDPKVGFEIIFMT